MGKADQCHCRRDSVVKLHLSPESLCGEALLHSRHVKPPLRHHYVTEGPGVHVGVGQSQETFGTSKRVGCGVKDAHMAGCWLEVG